jgi:repressor LexA
MTEYRLEPLASPTPRQRQVLECIISYIDDNGYPPSQRDIASGLQLRSTSTVVKHLKSLEHMGYIRRSSVSRSIVLALPASNSIALPILGTVRAGHLSQAIEDVQGYFSVDHHAIKGNDCFFLRVSGESMIGKGIFDGDLALVRPQPTAQNKETVVAMVDGEATLKSFFIEGDHIRLQPANPAMEPIILRPEDGEVTIVGKVIGVYRKLE